MKAVQPGLLTLRQEIARQREDGAQSLESAIARAKTIARSIRSRGVLLLLGMGASHWLNRMVAPLYRSRGILCVAEEASNQLRAPWPEFPRTTILVSQSGASGEILSWLDGQTDRSELYGITMEGGSPLASRLHCLVGTGGREQSFAATRSLVICLALHAAILSHLGIDTRPLARSFGQPPPPEHQNAVELLAKGTAQLFLARHPLLGVAEAGALSLMELGRLPVMAMEGGQFLHGPVEILHSSLGLVLFRGSRRDDPSFHRICRLARECTITPVVFDTLTDADLPGVVRVEIPHGDQLACMAETLMCLQAHIVSAAALRVPDVGIPLRSRKITDGDQSS